MIVKFYKNTSDNIVVDKVLTHVSDKEVTLTGSNVKESPYIVLGYDSNIANANYCYIAEFNRYYFVSPHELNEGGRMTLRCTTDLLTSAKADIRNSVGTAHRTGNKETKDIVDRLVSRTSKVDIEVRTFGEPLPTKDGGSFIMITAG